MDTVALLATLSVQQRAGLTAGSALWTVPGIPEAGIPTVILTDGPNGARGPALPDVARVASLCVPCGSALGATWDPELVELVGRAVGEQTRDKGARVLLAPTVNLPRSPLFGRSFECYAEDPLLTGKVAAGFIRGVQSRGVAATVKHLVGNEAEFERLTISSDIDERALRELYLLPFEMAIAEGQALAVMTSYNRVNGRWCAEDRHLVTEVLRGDFGFDGIVMTDWYAVGSTVDSAAAGLDLQMPGPGRFFGAVLATAVADGEVPAAQLEAIAARWLTLIDRLDAWADQPVAPRAHDRPEHRAIARRASTDSMVLLRNDGVLPLQDKASVALIGPRVSRPALMGGGSAQLRPHQQVSVVDVLRRRLGDALAVEPGGVIDRAVPPIQCAFSTSFDDGRHQSEERDGRLFWLGPPAPDLGEAFTFRATGRLHVEEPGEHLLTMSQSGRARLTVNGAVVIDGVSASPPPGSALFGMGSAPMEARCELPVGEVEVVVDYSSEGSALVHGVLVGHQPHQPDDLMERAVRAASQADVAVVMVTTGEEWESEGFDRETLELPGDQAELVRRVCAANRRTVVVVNAGAPVDLACADDAAAVLVSWLGGEEMAEALGEVLFGEAEPAGRLPVTFPQRIEHTPAYGAFPGENHHVRYTEGLMLGYRWYDTRLLPTAFPFGHGGSYTTFAWQPPVLSSTTIDPDGQVVIEVGVTNTGTRRGAEVVQLYVEPPPGRMFRPRRELKAFAKVWADPGETVVARLVLDPRAFACFDPGSTETAHLAERLGDGVVVPAVTGPTPSASPGWRVEQGPHRLLLARSVADVVAEAVVEVTWSGALTPAP